MFGGALTKMLFGTGQQMVYSAVVPGGPFVKTRYSLPQIMLVKKKNKL